jgi:CRISPR-associated protein Cmr1
MKTRVLQHNAPEVKVRPDDRIRQVRRYRLITPLFGGGVEPNKADPVTVVRGTEVRGQLRFWWRATRGGQFKGDLNAMCKAEEAIWGSAAAEGKPGPSKVIISISNVKDTQEFQKIPNKKGKEVDVGHLYSPYSYVAFSLRAESGKPAGKLRQEGIEFTLTITFPRQLEKPFDHLELKQEVEASLWAWETFGGIGARTRRGFGALQSITIDGKPMGLPTINQAQPWIFDGMRKHVVLGHWPEDVPHLTQNTMFVPAPKSGKANPIEAWRYLIDKLKVFRQARYPDRNRRPYGRSKWPEPDEVRRLTNTYAPQHTPRHTVRKFPRGQFGLPIIFHFKDEKQGDPPQITLQGAEYDRFASPLILRPLACADGAIGLALRLVSPESPPGGYVIKSDDQLYPVQVRGLSKSEASQIEPLNGEPDVLQAFLNFLSS